MLVTFTTAITLLQIRGLAVAVKPKDGQQNASVTCVTNVTVGSHQRRGFTLTPGINDKWRHITVLGESIGDIPTRYTITGLEAHELSVIGEWVNHTFTPISHREKCVHSTET
jgi:hypothetical protein